MLQCTALYCPLVLMHVGWVGQLHRSWARFLSGVVLPFG